MAPGYPPERRLPFALRPKRQLDLKSATALGKTPAVSPEGVVASGGSSPSIAFATIRCRAALSFRDPTKKSAVRARKSVTTESSSRRTALDKVLGGRWSSVDHKSSKKCHPGGAPDPI